MKRELISAEELAVRFCQRMDDCKIDSTMLYIGGDLKVKIFINDRSDYINNTIEIMKYVKELQTVEDFINLEKEVYSTLSCIKTN